VPPQEVLDRAVELRRALDEQRDKALPAFADKLLLVTGHAKFTPDGYELDASEGLVYLNADGGDGRVTLASALLPGVRTWTLDCDHGSLPDASAFDAYLELLERGDTAKLERLGWRRARAARRRRGRRDRASSSRARRAASPAAAARSGVGSLLGAPVDEAGAAATRGAGARGQRRQRRPDLRASAAARRPLPFDLADRHRVGRRPPARRRDGGALQAGLYPDEVGLHQVFVNTRCRPDNPWRRRGRRRRS
jgi:hypothetical protein